MKRYQVFVSSPKEDLVKEREQLLLNLISQKYMPTGMETFAASTRPTWEYITRSIDLSDYYLLILKEHYGSQYDASGISWTEKEYDYAVEKGKPIVVLLKRNVNTSAMSDRMRNFRSRLESEKLLDYWDEINNLCMLAQKSLDQAILEYPSGGWVRTENFLDEESSLLYFASRSSDYDFSDFILTDGTIRILLNDGYTWKTKYRAALEQRFRAIKHPTLLVHIAEHSQYISVIAAKSLKTVERQQGDIRELRAFMLSLAETNGYELLGLRGRDGPNTHCLYINSEFALVNTYMTSNNRFLQLPLYKFKAHTSVYDDFFQDFDLIHRSAA